MSNANTTTPYPTPSALAPKTPNGQLVLLPLALLFTDHQYQRGLVTRHIATILQFFDRRVFTPPIVVKRPDGTYYVIDGQQRVAALRESREQFTHIYVQLIEVDVRLCGVIPACALLRSRFQRW